MNPLLFWLFAFLMLAFGVGVVVNRNPVASALSLVVSFLCLAVLFVGLDAYLIASVQVVVYAGAVMVLFLFIIMLLDLKAEQRRQYNRVGMAGAALVALAEAHAKAGDPDRSLVFLAVTAEESGLLGAHYYAENPVFPLAQTVGGINMDVNGYGWEHRPAAPSSAELAEATRRWYAHAIQAFGPERCMFESNFPVDKSSCGYTVVWNSFKILSKGYSASERAAMFHDTAARVYRL